MRYTVELKPRAEKDLRGLSPLNRERVVERLRWLEVDLRGDVKRLTNHTPEYRMRAGDYRVLFEVAKNRVVVYRILPRGDACRGASMSIHPQIIEKDGIKEFVVLPYEEFLKIQGELEDYEDLRTLREESTRASREPTRKLDDILREVED